MVDVATQLWLWDKDLSSFLAVNSRPESEIAELRPIFLVMEWLVHGIPWLVVTAISMFVCLRYQFDRTVTDRFTVLLFGLLLDLAAIGVSKMSVRRRRPPYDKKDQVYEAPVVDKYSFPSGHSSRGAMLAVLGLNIVREGSWSAFLLKCFALLLGLSRVMAGRHYVSDVLAGLLLGWCEGMFILYLVPDSFITFLQSLVPFTH
uniref:Phosphatidic acid phosphatase type 2/haloperoxidase domain-containing protein n=1 Tax=Plectus sambesii TaxID=2011161 RepID=A0A914VSY7_9BILA